jgi:invasion protein IalB
VVFSGSSFAGQLKFGDWVCILETDPLTNKENKRIGTFAKDGISTLWLSESDSDEETIQLTLRSKKTMVSEYFSYRIDNMDTLTIRSAFKGCESKCLTEYIPKKDRFITTLKRGLQIEFEYDSYPQIAQIPTFSLRGFTKAYNWLVSK